jgi:sugar phosphate isomerase/epimerase
MNELSLAHLTIPDASPVELARAAARAGFEGVGLRITGFSPQSEGPAIVNRPHAIRELRQTLAAGQLCVTSVCSYRMTPEIVVEDYGPVIDACLEIGASTMLITCFIEDRALAAEKINRLAQQTHPLGLRLGIEFLRTSALRSLDDVEDLRGRLAAPNVGHIIDALHLCRSGHQPADLRRVSPEDIYGVQICDAKLSPPLAEAMAAEVRSRLLPGEGELPLFKLLDSIGTGAWIEIEAPKASHAGLTTLERAALAKQSGRSLLDGYARRDAWRHNQLGFASF